MKKIWKKYNILIIGGFFVLLFIILSFLIKDDGVEKPHEKLDITQYEISEAIKGWAEDTEEGYVLGVIAASTCHWCQEYKPIFESVVTDYNLDSHWFEVDLLEGKDDYTVLTELYPISSHGFSGGTPYTMLTYNGEFVDYIGGYVEEAEMVEFLQENNVIE